VKPVRRSSSSTRTTRHVPTASAPILTLSAGFLPPAPLNPRAPPATRRPPLDPHLHGGVTSTRSGSTASSSGSRINRRFSTSSNPNKPSAPSLPTAGGGSSYPNPPPPAALDGIHHRSRGSTSSARSIRIGENPKSSDNTTKTKVYSLDDLAELCPEGVDSPRGKKSDNEMLANTLISTPVSRDTFSKDPTQLQEPLPPDSKSSRRKPPPKLGENVEKSSPSDCPSAGGSSPDDELTIDDPPSPRAGLNLGLGHQTSNPNSNEKGNPNANPNPKQIVGEGADPPPSENEPSAGMEPPAEMEPSGDSAGVTLELPRPSPRRSSTKPGDPVPPNAPPKEDSQEPPPEDDVKNENNNQNDGKKASSPVADLTLDDHPSSPQHQPSSNEHPSLPKLPTSRLVRAHSTGHDIALDYDFDDDTLRHEIVDLAAFGQDSGEEEDDSFSFDTDSDDDVGRKLKSNSTGIPQIAVLALCKTKEKVEKDSGGEQLACKFKKFSAHTPLSDVAHWFAADSEPLDTFTLNQRLFHTSSVVSIGSLLAQGKSSDTGLVICIGPVQNEQGESRLAYSITPSPLQRIEAFAAQGRPEDYSNTSDLDDLRSRRTRFTVTRKPGPRDIGWVDPFDWDEPEYNNVSVEDLNKDRDSWLKPRAYYGVGQGKKTNYTVPKKLGPRDIPRQRQWKAATFKEALPDFTQNFLTPRLSYVPRKTTLEKHEVKKIGPREIGRASTFVPYTGWEKDDTGWLEEKRSYIPRKLSEEEMRVPKKIGPRESGVVKDFKPYTGWADDQRGWLEEKLDLRVERAASDPKLLDRGKGGPKKAKTPRLPGPRDIGRASDFVPYKPSKDKRPASARGASSRNSSNSWLDSGGGGTKVASKANKGRQSHHSRTKSSSRSIRFFGVGRDPSSKARRTKKARSKTTLDGSTTVRPTGKAGLKALKRENRAAASKKRVDSQRIGTGTRIGFNLNRPKGGRMRALRGY